VREVSADSRYLTKKWRIVSGEWRAALPHLVILFGDRFTPVTE
jgi:hypothetical protein